MKNIVAVKKDKETRGILAVKTEDGKVYEGPEMISAGRNGEFKHVQTIDSERGSYLRSIKDNEEGNNLDNLPEF